MTNLTVSIYKLRLSWCDILKMSHELGWKKQSMQSQECRTLGLLGTNRPRPLERAFQDASDQPRVNLNKYVFAQKHPRNIYIGAGLV